MEYEHRPFSKKAIAKMVNLDRSLLFADVGTGKTAMILYALEMRHEFGKPALPLLIVSTKRVITSVWPQEIEKWDHSKQFKYAVLNGSPDDRILKLGSKADIFLINFELVPWLIKQPGAMTMFKGVVVDECSKLASHRCHVRKTDKGTFVRFAGGLQAKSIARISINAPFFVGATGTPCTNSVFKLWGQAWFVDGGRQLGKTYSEFTNRFGENITKPGSLYPQIVPKKESLGWINELISQYTTVIRAEDYLDIKKINYVKLKTDLPPKVRDVYDSVKKNGALKVKGADHKGLMLAASGISMKLLQIASGFVMYEDTDGGRLVGEFAERQTVKLHEEKIDALRNLIEEVDRPMLVCYFFKESRSMLEKNFDIEFLDNNKNMNNTVNRWNAGKIPLLGIHWQSGHGLNLQYGGHDMAMFDMRYDAELFEQVINRIGPTRQLAAGFDRVVNVYLMLANDTIDEIAYNAVRNKLSNETVFKQLFNLEI